MESLIFIAVCSTLLSMYFRLKNTPSGQVLQLIESYRDAESRPRQRVVISLGDAKIPKEDWLTIAKAVERQLYGKTELFSYDHPVSIQQWIDVIIRRIDLQGRWISLSKYKSQSTSPSSRAQQAESIIDGVIAEKVSHTATTMLGPVLVANHAWQQLKIDDCLTNLGFNKSQKKVAAASVMSRLVDPVSENGMTSWALRTALPELLGDDLVQGGKDRFYRISDKLLANKTDIESHLRSQERRLFSLQRTVFLYDLTNTYFEGTASKNDKAKRGKSKHKRNDCPQVVVGIVFDQNGFELGHEIFEGNRNDATTLVEMLKTMQKVVQEEASLFSLAKPMVVMDAGIATKKNLQILREEGFEYLVNDSRRGRKNYLYQFLEDEKFSNIDGRDRKTSVQVRMITESPGQQQEDKEGDRLILCKSEGRLKKEEAIRSNAENKFLEALNKLSDRVLKGRLKRKEKIINAVGRVLAKHPRVARFYTVSVEKSDKPTTQKNTPAHKVVWSRDDEKHESDSDLFGCYVLRTNSKTDLTAQEIWELYITLTRAEEGFRCLKSNLGLRPLYHHNEERVDGHIFITILAYHLLQFILYSLKRQGDSRSWETIKRVLSTHCYTTIILPTNKNETHRIRKAGIPEEGQKAIYKSLGIEWRNLPVIKNKS